MINFCLTVILLSALRKIMYQIDSNTVDAFDNKLENAFLFSVGLIIFCKNIIMPTKTETALYARQKELAVENFNVNLDSLKTASKTVSKHFANKENSNKAITALKLLSIHNNDTPDYENQSHAA